MKTGWNANWIWGAIALLAVAIVTTNTAGAHCDTMNGPVVTAAKKALEKGEVNLVLIWVRQEDEKEIREAFQKTLEVRKFGPEAKALADRYFFETLVRLHRAGEGVAYTGLKAEGQEVEAGIAAADKALETGKDELLLKELIEAVRHGVHERFAEVQTRKGFAPNDVHSGREYVRKYVEFIRYVERLHNSVSAPAHGHTPEGTGRDPH